MSKDPFLNILSLLEDVYSNWKQKDPKRPQTPVDSMEMQEISISCVRSTMFMKTYMWSESVMADIGITWFGYFL